MGSEFPHYLSESLEGIQRVQNEIDIIFQMYIELKYHNKRFEKQCGNSVHCVRMQGGDWILEILHTNASSRRIINKYTGEVHVSGQLPPDAEYPDWYSSRQGDYDTLFLHNVLENNLTK